MRIGFDGKRAIQNNTGLGNYSRYVVEIMSEFHPENSYVLFAPKKKKNPRLKKLLSQASVSFRFPETFLKKRLSALWRLTFQRRDLQREQIEIFHGLSNEIPIGIGRTGIKSVVTIHDLIFLRFPQYYHPIDRFIYKLKFRYACRQADKIIAISESTKRDIVNFFSIPENKIEVVYQGCHPVFSKEVENKKREEVRIKYTLPAEYLLYVGTIESRKNLLLVVKAIKSLPENIRLVAVGKRTVYQHEVEEFIRDNNMQHRVQVFNQIPFEDLPAFYSQAKIFVYPSFFEGFGIPIIEAMSQGIPVIAATGSCLEEAGGKHSLYVHPENAQELSEKIENIWNNPEQAQLMSEQGREYVKKFSDEKIADDLLSVYASLI